MQQSRTVYHYISIRSEQAPLRMRIKEIAASRVRYGYQRMYILLRREGWVVTRKRVHRLYREEGLNLRHIKRNKRHLNVLRNTMALLPQQANECWTMDFVSDSLFDGRRMGALTVLDVFTRESLAIEGAKACVAMMRRLFCPALLCSVERRKKFVATTAANSPRKFWTTGPMKMVWSLNIHAPASPRTTPISSRSTGDFVRNACQRIGS